MCTKPFRQTNGGAIVYATKLAASQIQAHTASEAPLWELSLGAKVAHYPKYMGSNNSETQVLLMIEGYRALGESTLLFSSDFSLGLDWQIAQPIHARLPATGRLGRDSSDSQALSGNIELYKLYGDAADSPIVDKREQLVPTLSASHGF